MQENFQYSSATVISNAREFPLDWFGLVWLGTGFYFSQPIEIKLQLFQPMAEIVSFFQINTPLKGPIKVVWFGWVLGSTFPANRD